MTTLASPITRPADPCQQNTVAATPSRRVLMISLVYPPSGGGGVQRTAKFARYLPEFGWLPCIWSAPRIHHLPIDRSLELDVEGCGHHRTLRAFEWSHHADRASKWIERRCAGRGHAARMVSAAAWRAARAVRWLTARIPPDDHLGWVLRSFPRLCEWSINDRIDAVYSTHGPPSNHLLALLVASVTGKPWVADFRDPWTQAFNYHRATPWQHRLNKLLERRILNRADGVIGATPRLTADLRRIVRVDRENRFHTIRNGVDLHDFDRTSKTNPTGITDERYFRLTFVGHCIRDRFPDVVQQGLTRFVAHCRRENRPFRFRIVGPVSGNLRPWLQSLAPYAEYTGYLAHADAVDEMRNADMLLATIRASEKSRQAVVAEGAKIFEYMAAQRPILLIAATGSEAELVINSCHAGTRIPLDARAIATGLERALHLWQANELPPGCPRETVEPFTRRAGAGKLATILNRLTQPVGSRNSANL